jgi:heme-degrading monooxygenase HmoA
MEVITFVKGNVPSSKAEKFEAGFESLKRDPLPEGLIASYLLHDAGAEETYAIETVWTSQEALENMRSEAETPAAIALFEKVGVKPTFTVYKMANNLP